jgi:uncharacterized protein YoxC
MIIQLSVAIIALAFVVLVVFLILTLRSFTAMLEHTSQTLTRVERHVGAISSDSSELIQHVKEIAVDVQDKITKLDSAITSFKQSGDAAKEVTSSFRQVSSAVAHFIQAKRKPEPVTTVDRVTEIIRAIPELVDVWHKLKKSR